MFVSELLTKALSRIILQCVFHTSKWSRCRTSL